MASIRASLNVIEEEDRYTPLQLVNEATRWSLNWFTSRPNFFTPFESVTDAALAVVNPFVGPIVLGVMAVAAGLMATLTGIVAVSAYFYSKVAGCFNEEEAERAMDDAVSTACHSIAAAVATLLFAIGAFVITPVSAVQLLTRTGTTVVSKMADCCENDEEVLLGNHY